MSSGGPSTHPSMPPNLDQAIKKTYRSLNILFGGNIRDDEIKQSLTLARIIVHDVIEDAEDLKLNARLKSRDQFSEYLKLGTNEQELIDSLRSMAEKKEWADLLKHEAFFKQESKKDKPDPIISHATKSAWGDEYKGNLADILRETIADYLSKKITPYARLTTVVNSSGTGKSRMVDQLGTEIITVPMCLRQWKRKGFPPVDEDLRRWLVSNSDDRGIVQRRLQGFIFSLLMVTREQLETIAKEEDISESTLLDEEAAKKWYREKPEECVRYVVNRQKKLASAFRKYMTEGELYNTSSPNRSAFYAHITDRAKQFVASSKPVEDEKERQHLRYVSEGNDLQGAGKALCHFIDEHHFLDAENGPRRPLVVFAFDEADALTDNPPDMDWNLFSELRRVLRQIKELPIFSLFLSTAGRFEKFSPVIRYSPSARAREPDNRPLDPITEISFDDIAYPALKGTITIRTVVTTDWIAHLGRPLFGSYWDNVNVHYRDSAVMDFAKQKLLGGPSELRTDNLSGSLACLSVRFALEFGSDEIARDMTLTQVEQHMRLCIATTVGLEKLITVPGSEPLLAEAAYELMKGTETNSVRQLAGHSDLNCIDRGRRGELVATLLIMQAYDAARENGKRWVSVVNFMEALLPPSKFDDLLQSSPTTWPKNYDDHTTFEDMFKDYGMWFNHVIKIEDKKMVSIEHLWKFVVRGAMVLCATNLEGIDIVLPVCHMAQNLSPDSVTAIVIQVKNAKDFTAKLKAKVFDDMDSVVKSAIFSEPEELPDSGPDPQSTPAEPKKKKRKVTVTKPVIRMVFALASPEPAVAFKERPEKRNHHDEFAAFDVWLAGLTDKTYKQINDADVVPYQTLLERSLAPHDAFELKDVPQTGEVTRKLRGARRRKMVPLTFSEHAHHSIH